MYFVLKVIKSNPLISIVIADLILLMLSFEVMTRFFYFTIFQSDGYDQYMNVSLILAAGLSAVATALSVLRFVVALFEAKGLSSFRELKPLLILAAAWFIFMLYTIISFLGWLGGL